MKIWAPNSYTVPSHLSGSTIIVDNRTLLLGLDELYRAAMKRYEQRTLLPHARALAALAQVTPATHTIEGYYGETPELTEYFQLVRTMQACPPPANPDIVTHPAYLQITRFMQSPIFGPSADTSKLLPQARDSLYGALKRTVPNWNVRAMMQAAQQDAYATDDISLVGLAARTGDAVPLAALRESVVLYEQIHHFGIEESPEVNYQWMVDPEVAEAAQRFIMAVHQFIPDSLPAPSADNAGIFFEAFLDNDIIGRCVRIGATPDERAHYHWAIYAERDEQRRVAFQVDSFWSDRLWTTITYRDVQRTYTAFPQPFPMRPFQLYGVPQW